MHHERPLGACILRTQMINDATQAGLVDNRNDAVRTAAAILNVVHAVRTGRPLTTR
jgi:hypothetical protein